MDFIACQLAVLVAVQLLQRDDGVCYLFRRYLVVAIGIDRSNDRMRSTRATSAGTTTTSRSATLLSHDRGGDHRDDPKGKKSKCCFSH
jgi:hypothetical protein